MTDLITKGALNRGVLLNLEIGENTMTDLIVRENNLPTTLEDLSAFVLFNDEKVKAVRAALSAMHKLKAPREVYELKLREAQELSEQVALAKIELGKRISEIPKATNNNPTGNNQYSGQIDSPVDSTVKQKPKSETIAELGLTQKQAERFQQMAQNPDAVQAAMTKAREAGDVVSQARIISEIKQAQKETRQEERRERKAYTPPDEVITTHPIADVTNRDGCTFAQVRFEFCGHVHLPLILRIS